MRTIAILALLFLSHASFVVAQESAALTRINSDWRIWLYNSPPQGDQLMYLVDEFDVDLNGDGDTKDDVFHYRNLSSGRTVNLGLAGNGQAFGQAFGQAYFSEGRFFIQGFESSQDQDFNGDGDKEDRVVHVFDVSSEETTNLRLSGYACAMYGNRVVVMVNETEEGRDLNGDGDTEDYVFHLINIDSGEIKNLGLSNYSYYFQIVENWLSFVVSEHDQQADLNGDGDTEDYVFHLLNIDTGEIRNLGLSSGSARFFHEDWLAFLVSE